MLNRKLSEKEREIIKKWEEEDRLLRCTEELRKGEKKYE